MPFDLPPVPQLKPRFNSLDEIDEIHAQLTKTFRAGTTRPLAYRRRQLLQLARMLQDNHVAFEDALIADLNRPRVESALIDLGASIAAALTAVESLEEWAAPEERPAKQEWRAGWGGTVHKEPKGVVLIIAPWNYPVVLLLSPLAGALAAGCTVLLKPSELAPATSALLAALLPAYIDPAAVAVAQGGAAETAHALSARRWDHIFFTGGTRIGRVVTQAAANTLTPVTLELGGKSAVVLAGDVLDDAEEMETVARRVWHGRLHNAGQLCVSPDYVLVPRERMGAFVGALEKVHGEFFAVPEGEGPLVQVGNIINTAHCQRVRDLLLRTKGRIVFGGEKTGEKTIAPAVVADVPEDDSLMEDEIFGPILPVVPIDSTDDAIRILNSKAIPLVIYLFTNEEAVKQRFLQETRSGQLVLNDVVSQLAVTELPFGGQGDSGYGAWFGKHTFDTFSHSRGSINVPLSDEKFMKGRYRPFTQEQYDASQYMWKMTIPDM